METETCVRSSASYQNIGEINGTFRIEKLTFTHQFSQIYFARMTELSPIIDKSAQSRWSSVKGTPFRVNRILDVKPGELCYVIGTLYVDLLLKPNILQELSHDVKSFSSSILILYSFK